MLLFKSKQSFAAGLFIDPPVMTEPAGLALLAAAWGRQISWHVTCGYRKCSPGSNGVPSNVWLCLNSPCVSSESLPAIRESGYEPWERRAPKGPWGSSRPSGVLDSSATYFCLFRQRLWGFFTDLQFPSVWESRQGLLVSNCIEV